ncbi:hypothetical protein Ddc_22244 [Ditylenchus destructor]|nr:hypothetical protein Ddc_22244 [Ditylenchus destructor]
MRSTDLPKHFVRSYSSAKTFETAFFGFFQRALKRGRSKYFDRRVATRVGKEEGKFQRALEKKKGKPTRVDAFDCDRSMKSW